MPLQFTTPQQVISPLTSEVTEITNFEVNLEDKFIRVEVAFYDNITDKNIINRKSFLIRNEPVNYVQNEEVIDLTNGVGILSYVPYQVNYVTKTSTNEEITSYNITDSTITLDDTSITQIKVTYVYEDSPATNSFDECAASITTGDSLYNEIKNVLYNKLVELGYISSGTIV